jgi:hypothetical protein
VKSDRSSFSGAAIGCHLRWVGQDEDEDEPDDPAAFEPEAVDFDAVDRDDEPAPDDFDAVDFDAVDFEDEPDDFDAVDEPDDFVVDPDLEEPSVPETCRTNFLALSRTVSLTSPTRAIAKSFAVWTPSWTAGWFQTPSAAFRICSYRSRPALVPST